MLSTVYKTSGKRSQKSSQKRNYSKVKKRSAKKKPLHLPKEESRSIEPEQISETVPEDNYDGYYYDVLPVDEGRFSEGMDKSLIKKVIVIIGAVLLIVALCVGMMYAL